MSAPAGIQPIEFDVAAAFIKSIPADVRSLCEHNDTDEGFCTYCSVKMYKEQV